MDFYNVLHNIELIQCAVYISDDNLNLIAKNNFAQLSEIKTRMGASLNHYISQTDISKIKALKNKDCIIVDFIKSTITSFAVIRYDLNVPYFILIEAHVSCFIEKRISNSIHAIIKTIEHYKTITNQIFEKDLNHIDLPNDRTVQKKLKINHYIKNLILITYNSDSNSYKQVNDLIYEFNGIMRIFDLLSKSVGMNVIYHQSVKKEILGRYNRGDAYLATLVILYFAFITAGDKQVICNVVNFDKYHYFTVDYATMLGDETVMKLISSADSIDFLSDTCEYEYLYLLKLIKRLLRNYSGDLSFSLPGNSLSNLRISAKFTENNIIEESYHESNWIDDQNSRIADIMNYGNIITENQLNADDSAFDRVYDVVKMIPKGMVTNYGRIAALSGNPKWSRVVGYALHVNPDPSTIPCHRVVNKEGGLSPAFAFGGKNKQRELLEAEGVTFDDEGKVDLAKHYWDGIK